MGENQDYKEAYEQQRKARERAEAQLEERSRELFETVETLGGARQELNDQQANLLQQEKLASIGLLAAGIAHEINNPIGFIKSNLQTLEEYLSTVNKLFDSFQAIAQTADRDPESINYRSELERLVKLARDNDLEFLIRDSLDSIKESLDGVNRVQDIINNMKDFASSDSGRRRLCDINEVLDNTLKLLRNDLRSSCDIDKQYGEISEIYGSDGQLSQVFLNIMINATQAMGEGGALTLKTEADEDQVYIHFIDSGPGIDAENLPHLFDPFFTTKDIGSGTGLGLYVSHGIVENHRGQIRAQNEADGGARFTVILPIDIRKHRR